MQVKIGYHCIKLDGIRRTENYISYQISTNNENWREKIKKEFNDILENEKNLVDIRIGI